jgi:hypothetical protein
MLNVFKYFEKPDELNRHDLQEHMHLLDLLSDARLSPEAKSQLEPVLHIIKKSPKLAYYYAKTILDERWPEAEPYIIKDPYWAYVYTYAVINKDHKRENMIRWKEAEPVIMKDAESAGMYAGTILQSRWPEAEPVIMKDPHEASMYAEYVIKGRWEEAEPVIKTDEYYWNEYQNFLKTLDDEY